MAWMSVLYRTYENNSHMAGKTVAGAKPLSPVSHSVEKTHLLVQLSSEGEFVDAIVDDLKIIIPVTESSASRTSGIVPHCLCDNLAYIAGDFAVYLASPKEASKAQKKFEAYMEQLAAWAHSPYSYPVVDAVFAYLSKKELIADLVGKGIITLQNGRFDSGKLNKIDYDKVMVRFCVNTAERIVNSWEDVGLMDAFIQYYAQTQENRWNTCFLTGQPAVISENHPKNIVAATYGAKLVCVNDSNYVYRGRFVAPQEALTVSYDASQKAHAALTWLVSNQGVTIGTKDTRTYVCWNPNGKPVPFVLGSDSIFSGKEEENDRPNTVPAFQDKLRKTLRGYANRLTEADDVVLMSLEAATTGRLSITYYNSLPGSDFLARIDRWGNSCNWRYRRKKKDEDRGYDQIETPTFEQIVKCAFGTQQGNFVDVDDRVLREHTQRLVHAMLTGGKVPSDIVRAVAARAANPLAYSYWNYQNLLSTACAVISQRYYNEKDEKNEVKFDMSQEQYANDRSFLYGCLLAIFDKIERQTYGNGEGRETNAQRLQAMFVNYPLRTRGILEQKLEPYFKKLSNPYNENSRMSEAERYRKMIGEINAKFVDMDKDDMNKRLSDTYLLGYYLQRQELYKGKEEEEDAAQNSDQ
ncbi:MAG: type I-C CRISPR-associated protein Cas8c/Csd1 [Oscillospiraceae bacterium]|jgi:CRISPR-associated protein Csd1|nr:type I-C CRISPR-associated protein Cas8c/Csd1 [Oscillospiraceae bacterium]